VLTHESLARIDAWTARQEIECLYFLADPGDPATAPLAEAAGFRLVDLRITLEHAGSGALGTSPAPPVDAAGAPGARPAPADIAGVSGAQPAPEVVGAVVVRAAAPADVAALRRIAAASHHDSRFYADPHFSRERCDALYAAWIGKSCDDPQGAVLVAANAAPGGGPAGYITAALDPGGGGRIGLFAVAAAAQGRGVGSRLVDAALAWFAERGAAPVRVVTQGRNLRAQRLYQKAGLRTSAVELWFHRWRTQGGGSADASAWG
jgi:dTDP-4-amino-4,6-dideoxy-D-galactose acyltransferase